MLKTMDMYKPKTGGQQLPAPYSFGPKTGGHQLPPPYNPGGGQQVDLGQPTNPYQLTPRQTNSQYNYDRAAAAQAADPRAAAKPYQRGGLSSSKGTAMLGGVDAARAYASGMAQAEAGRMQDAYTNANIRLGDQVERDRFGNALVGLQEQSAQDQWMNQYQNMQNATGFMDNMFDSMGNIFGGMGGGKSVLSGLL